MKKLIGILLATLLTSCSILPEYLPPTMGEYDVPVLSSENEIIDWIFKNITYQSDMEQYNYIEYYATIEEIMASRKGDCEDFANLFLVMVKQNLGKEGRFHIYENPNEDGAHAVGVVDECRCYDAKGFDILVKDYSYETAMLRIGTKWGYDGVRPKGIMMETGL